MNRNMFVLLKTIQIVDVGEQDNCLAGDANFLYPLISFNNSLFIRASSSFIIPPRACFFTKWYSYPSLGF